MAETNGDVLLSIRNLKTYFPTEEGLVRAVDGVSFDVKEGKTLGVVGESGCGKSTVGRAILRIIDKPGHIEDGEILWRTGDGNGGRREIDIAKESPESRGMRSIRGNGIALIFQEPMTSFSPVHTIGNQLMEVRLRSQQLRLRCQQLRLRSQLLRLRSRLLRLRCRQRRLRRR
jgi:ABC-type dipeptide/oligopeptide/nickel transport system ATPase component